MVTEWVGIVVTVVLGVVGLYLANSYRRRAQVDLADARRGAYAELWKITKTAAPTRLRTGGEGVLSTKERERLFKQLTDWYYKDGNGGCVSPTDRCPACSCRGASQRVS